MGHTFQKNDNDSFPNKELFEHYLNLIALSRKWNKDFYFNHSEEAKHFAHCKESGNRTTSEPSISNN